MSPWKRLLGLLVVPMCALVFFIGYLVGVDSEKRKLRRVTVSNYQKVHKGMNRKGVQELLGRPVHGYDCRTSRFHDFLVRHFIECAGDSLTIQDRTSYIQPERIKRDEECFRCWFLGREKYEAEIGFDDEGKVIGKILYERE